MSGLKDDRKVLANPPLHTFGYYVERLRASFPRHPAAEWESALRRIRESPDPPPAPPPRPPAITLSRPRDRTVLAAVLRRWPDGKVPQPPMLSAANRDLIIRAKMDPRDGPAPRTD